MMRWSTSANIRNDQHQQREHCANERKHPLCAHLAISERNRSRYADHDSLRKARDERAQIAQKAIRERSRRVELAERAHTREKMERIRVRVRIPRHPCERTGRAD